MIRKGFAGDTPLALRLGAAILFTALPAAHARAQGGPPLITDDPSTPGARRWEINVAIVAEKRGGERVIEAPLIDANYGWGECVQLKVEIPWVVHGAAGEPSRNGLGNVLLGVKWRFADEEKQGVAMGFYPQVELNVLSSSARRGISEERTGLLLPLIFEKNLGLLSANVEIGQELREGQESRWLCGLALGRELSDRVEVLAEIVATASMRWTRVDSSWNLGGRWKVARRLVLLLSAGSGIHGFANQPRARLLAYAGSQLLF